MARAPITPAARAAADDAEQAELEHALADASGNVAAAARTLGVCRRTLDRRINTLGLRGWLTATYNWSVRQPRRGSEKKKNGVQK